MWQSLGVQGNVCVRGEWAGGEGARCGLNLCTTTPHHMVCMYVHGQSVSQAPPAVLQQPPLTGSGSTHHPGPARPPQQQPPLPLRHPHASPLPLPRDSPAHCPCTRGNTTGCWRPLPPPFPRPLLAGCGGMGLLGRGGWQAGQGPWGSLTRSVERQSCHHHSSAGYQAHQSPVWGGRRGGARVSACKPITCAVLCVSGVHVE